MLAWLLFGLVVLLLAGLFLYWQLIIAEGAYLGAPLVALLYDWTAEKYNAIKQFDQGGEDRLVGAPLANRLARQPRATVLDVATGTGRVPLALFRQRGYRGRIIGVDRAARMLAVARRDTAGRSERVCLVQADAMALPFASHSLPLVTCLEALEFLPQPEAGLAELVRVLRPTSPPCPSCGWLITTQRIGWEARLMPGKTWSNEELLALLHDLPLASVEILPWEDIYNLVVGQKVE